jgi:chromosomal replication initiation ATPase DnaA
MKQDIFNEYVDKVVRNFRIKKEDLFAKSKIQEYVDARHLLYYLCFKRPMRVATIHNYMKDNGYDTNWSTIYRGINSFADKMRSDNDYKQLVKDIQNSITL